MENFFDKFYNRIWDKGYHEKYRLKLFKEIFNDRITLYHNSQTPLVYSVKELFNLINNYINHNFIMDNVNLIYNIETDDGIVLSTNFYFYQKPFKLHNLKNIGTQTIFLNTRNKCYKIYDVTI